jgi:hypothetical protein
VRPDNPNSLDVPNPAMQVGVRPTRNNRSNGSWVRSQPPKGVCILWVNINVVRVMNERGQSAVEITGHDQPWGVGYTRKFSSKIFIYSYHQVSLPASSASIDKSKTNRHHL